MARQNPNSSGIIIISARNALEERVKGLEVGADDYLVKPFHLSELVARVHSVARRTRSQGEEILTFGMIRVMPEERTCFVEDSRWNLPGRSMNCYFT